MQVKQVEHYTVLKEPGGQYLTHVTPTSGKGVDIAAEIVTVVRLKMESMYKLVMFGYSL